MKIYRSGITSPYRNETDRIPAAKLAKQWTTSGCVHLDGTIDKTGDRHTRLEIELADDDIEALAAALAAKRELERAKKERSKEVLLRWQAAQSQALIRIVALAKRARRSAQSIEKLQAELALIQQVAAHYWGPAVYGDEIGDEPPRPPRIRGLKWNSLIEDEWM